MAVPDFVLFNSSGQGYGVWPVDRAMFNRLQAMDKALHRASAYISLYENMLNGRSVKPLELLNLLAGCIGREKEELNLKLITGYMSTIYWEFISVQERTALHQSLEEKIWKAMLAQQQPNHRKLLFKTYQDVFLSKQAMERLYGVWKRQAAPNNIKLSEDDYTSLAFSLALREGHDPAILKEQLGRISNADRKTRFEFIMPAVSSDPAERDAFFGRLELRSNRSKEANVGTALYYLHHPLRQQTSVKYLQKSLDLLEEIQATGDIFFPQNWLQSILNYYQDKQAAEIVTGFLTAHPGYNPKLKAKLLQAADNLFRARKLLNGL
jgi:aminopeptidase N